MTTYSFKRDCDVYVVYGGLRWKIEVYPDLNFSQTFNETAIKVKTLHDQNAMFDEATITKANPADFNFTVLLTKGSDFLIIGDWLTTRAATGSDEALLAYDVYVDNGVDVFKLRKAIAARGTFLVQRDAFITVSIEGQASQLTKYGASGVTIPGTLQLREPTIVPIVPRAMLLEIEGVTQGHIAGISFEITNNIEWIEYDTLHKSLYVTSTSDTSYPEDFVVVGKTLSGTIQQYVTENSNANLMQWKVDVPLRIRVGDQSAYFLDVNIPRVVYTNRMQVEEIFLQSYDFRMTSSPEVLSTVLNYNL